MNPPKVKTYALCLALLLSAGQCQAGILQFLYVEAAEGNSSGGHAALRIADKIYHFQYDNGYIRLFRQVADVFLKDYRFKQNRSIHAADIRVSGETFGRIEDYFKIRYQQQKQQLAELKASRQDLALIQALLALKQGKSITGADAEPFLPRLPGAGLYYPGQSSSASRLNQNECDAKETAKPAMADLQAKLRARYGDDFIDNKINRLRNEIGGLSPALVNPENADHHYGFAERYVDLMNGLLALQVLRDSKPLMSDVCFRITRPGFSLSRENKEQLARYHEAIQQSILSLADSKRPDWGYALFVSLARMMVVRQTLQTGLWTFLDDTGSNGTHLSKSDLRLYGAALTKLRRDDEKSFVNRMNDFGSAANPERAYANLEIHANRYRQWQANEREGGVSYRSEESLPGKDAAIGPFLFTGLPSGQLEKAAHRREAANERLFTVANEKNAYHLLTNNCVTALLSALDKAVSGQSRERLGGYIDPKLTAIPFQAYEAVVSSFQIAGTRKLPGYRELELAELYKAEEGALVYARESNILTSSLYRYHSEDAWFVFFTDDEILPRPLFGAVNVLAAAGQSAAGLFTWPFDKGRQLKTGVKGVLTSLPELAFFNIRKGSYPYALAQ